MHVTKTRAFTAIAAAALFVPLAAMPAANAAAAGLHVSQTLSSGFVGPLQFAVSGSEVLVADSFTSTLSQLGVAAPLASYSSPGGDLAGVAIDRNHHSYAYATSNADHTSTALHIVVPGKPAVTADISGFESAHNPDGINQYGIVNPSQCVIDAFNAQHIPVSYPGQLDSHPYAVTALGGGAWAVADAGGNDLLKVTALGAVSVLAVLPPQPVTITAGFAAGAGLPACAVGAVYNFEPVPTDVERGPDGALFMTSLPGGPEGPNSGNPGSVYRLAENGALSKIATGFHGATNLAIDSHGAVYVAEIGSGTISKVVAGMPKVVLALPGVVGLEFANGHLYASTAPAASGGAGPGTIVKLSS